MTGGGKTLLARPRGGGDGWELRSPGVGLYTAPPHRSRRLKPGEVAGNLVILERRFELLVPSGVQGIVDHPPPALRHFPVEFGTLLFTLGAGKAAASEEETAPRPAASPSGRLAVPAPQAGRFYRRPDPQSAPFLEEGGEVRPGKTFGILEVMKTFHPVKYAARDDLPERARAGRFLVEDGAEVEEGQPLLELEPEEG
ncbi:MAG: hypothetical protein ACE5H3_05650 [Planctomycetota bacterium]